MGPRARRGDGRRQRGAAAVEMAIMMPLLLLVLAGIVDFGRFFFTEIQLANAAREGARAAVVSEVGVDVTPRVLAAAPAVTGLMVDVEPCAGADGDATVTAAQPDFEWILLEPALNLFGAGTALPEATSTAVMRCGG